MMDRINQKNTSRQMFWRKMPGSRWRRFERLDSDAGKKLELPGGRGGSEMKVVEEEYAVEKVIIFPLK